MTRYDRRWIAVLTAAGLCLAATAGEAAAASKPAAGKKAAGSSATKTSAAPSKTDNSMETATPPKTVAAGSDSMSLKGGESGTVFDDMTIQGEDRIRIEFDRPALDLAIDPLSAPGLAWNRSLEVLNHGALGPEGALLARSAGEPCPYLAKPYISVLSSGPVVRFAPKLREVERWVLNVADSRGRTVATFNGTGTLPAEIAWDGVTAGGSPALPGLTYSFVLEAHDRAGNKRSFLGDAFEVKPYVRSSGDKVMILFTGRELATATTTNGSAMTANGSAMTAGPASQPAVLLETASRLNQVSLTPPIRIEAHARTADQAKKLADRVTGTLKSLVLGDPARFMAVTLVEQDAPETGSILIKTGS